MAELGLDGFAIDFVDAEGPVISYLNQFASLHRAVSDIKFYLCSLSQAVTQRAGIDINSEALFQAGITTWVTKTDSNRARRSNYGRRDYQVITLAPDAARAFNLAVDQEAVKKIVGEIAEMKKAKRDREAPHLDLRDRHDAARKKAQGQKDQAVHPPMLTSIQRSDVPQDALEKELALLKEQANSVSKARIDKGRYISIRA